MSENIWPTVVALGIASAVVISLIWYTYRGLRGQPLIGWHGVIIFLFIAAGVALGVSAYYERVLAGVAGYTFLGSVLQVLAVLRKDPSKESLEKEGGDRAEQPPNGAEEGEAKGAPTKESPAFLIASSNSRDLLASYGWGAIITAAAAVVAVEGFK